MSHQRLSISTFLFFLVLVCRASAGPVTAQTAGTASIIGTVQDKNSENPLPGATISVDGTRFNATADRLGKFRIVDLPAGNHVVKVSYIGYNTYSIEVEAKAGETLELNTLLLPYLTQTIEVSAPILEGQEKALNEQDIALNIKNVVAADQIGNFPDPNAAEAVQRIPGITLERDQGEGRYILIRGTSPNLTSISINGQQIPSPESDTRYVALDVIPADLLEAIEVNKVLTPDMEGDAIGGAVNLVTKQAPDKTRFSLTAGGGYNNIVDNGLGTVSGTFAHRFLDSRLGLVLGGSYSKTARGSHNFEPGYNSDGTLKKLSLRYYDVTRDRWGINPSFDLQPNNTSQYYVRTIFNRFGDQEYRHQISYKPNSKASKSVIERQLKDRYEVQDIRSVSFGGRNILLNGFEFDYSGAYGFANEDEPNSMYTLWTQSGVVFDPNVSATSIDPNNIQANPLNEDINAYTLDELTNERSFTSDRNYMGALNVKSRLPIGWLKFGAKYRYETKETNAPADILSWPGTYYLSDAVDPNFHPDAFLSQYSNPGWQFSSPSWGRSLAASPDITRAIDHSADGDNYDATEKVTAGYAMLNISSESRVSVIPGFRYEYTKTEYTGNDVQFNEDGDWISTTPIKQGHNYGDVMPGINFVYRFPQNTNLRFALTRSIARPNFSDLPPKYIIDYSGPTIDKGNPDLKPTRATNFDLMAEHYFKSVGIASVGYFYKWITSPIYPFFSVQDMNGESFEVSQPMNGQKAHVQGLEAAFQRQFNFLPSFLNGFGLYTNYTYISSEALFPPSEIDGATRTASLPGQAEHVGNFALSYEKYGFSGQLAMNYHGKYLSEVSDSAANDIWFDNHFQIDLSLSQRITKNVRTFANFVNLNGEPLRSYQGENDRPTQREYYSWWGTFGIKLDF